LVRDRFQELGQEEACREQRQEAWWRFDQRLSEQFRHQGQILRHVDIVQYRDLFEQFVRR
ncbi:MAG TPA: hypothetical protein DHW07_05755, partial [Gammaproteobacteria bacterium]|nr:hypothetical protein [Gammaproteobacteria bacterium]